ncbi:hypothetical protein B7R54_01715 [Subtercola boreus]|uniref:Uncharacterized protein n=2 Tax=Subtercola boreus TaxID=120213 RepID=A0A3E0VDU3_9MICO|nr:hypothetical protein B7R54_01715 [Subtercola boreus]
MQYMNAYRDAYTDALLEDVREGGLLDIKDLHLSADCHIVGHAVARKSASAAHPLTGISAEDITEGELWFAADARRDATRTIAKDIEAYLKDYEDGFVIALDDYTDGPARYDDIRPGSSLSNAAHKAGQSEAAHSGHSFPGLDGHVRASYEERAAENARDIVLYHLNRNV